MAIIYDNNGNPVRTLASVGGDVLTDSRQLTQSVAALNAEVFIDVQSEHTVSLNVSGTFSATGLLEATIDGNNYFQIPIWIPTTEVYLVGITVSGNYQADIPAGVRRIRLRCSAYTSGAMTIAMRASIAQDFVYSKPVPATLSATITAATGVAATLTLPAPGVGLYHYITRIIIQRHTSAALTAGATPILVTTTNMAGSRVFSFPADAAAQGVVAQEIVEPTNPLKSSASNTATTIVAPVVTGVIWRITVDYYIGA